MSETTKISDVEMYVFDDIDSRDIDLQEITGIFGEIQVKGSVLEHVRIENKGDYKIREKSQIMLRKSSEAKRFRYATDNSKPDGLGIIIRGDKHDFVFTSTNQNLSEVHKDVLEAI